LRWPRKPAEGKEIINFVASRAIALLAQKGVDLKRWIHPLSDKLNLFGDALSGIFLLIMALIVTYEVIMHFLFHSPTKWVLKIDILLCIGSVFFAALTGSSTATVATFGLIAIPEMLCPGVRRENLSPTP